MAKFRKRPVVIEASQWMTNGDHPLDKSRTITTTDGENLLTEGKLVGYFRHPDVPGSTACQHCGLLMHVHGFIDTVQGGHVVCPGDWIINEPTGEGFYPCKPDVFEATYDAVEA